jgi:DNA-3-methyladenine glycosylase I
VTAESALVRCPWAAAPVMHEYHDREWGVPVHDDRVHFEFLTLEGAQAGLSWQTILAKRDRYREVLDDFDPALIAKYGARKHAALMKDAGIVRNRLKIESLTRNSRAFLEVQEEFGSYDAYIWRFVDGRPLVSALKTHGKIPARTAVSDTMSKDLKRRGFNFVGSTICYAYMQAVGLVNDHLMSCFRYAPLTAEAARGSRS